MYTAGLRRVVLYYKWQAGCHPVRSGNGGVFPDDGHCERSVAIQGHTHGSFVVRSSIAAVPRVARSRTSGLPWARGLQRGAERRLAYIVGPVPHHGREGPADRADVR